MPVKPVTQWGKKTAKREDQQISNFAVDVKVLHYAVNDTVVETRGAFPVYRPGDIGRMLHGAVFQR